MFVLQYEKPEEGWVNHSRYSLSEWNAAAFKGEYLYTVFGFPVRIIDDLVTTRIYYSWPSRSKVVYSELRWQEVGF